MFSSRGELMQILHQTRLVLLGISLGLGCIRVGPSVHVVWSVLGYFYGSKLGVLRLHTGFSDLFPFSLVSFLDGVI